MHFTTLLSNIYMLLIIHQPHGTLAAKVSINQNIKGFVGNKDTYLICSFFLEKGEKMLSVQIIAKNITEKFDDKKPIAIFKPEEAANLIQSGVYLSNRVTLTNITTTSRNATMTFHMLKCTDEKYYICELYYEDVDGAFDNKKSEETTILLQAYPTRPDDISRFILSPKADRDGNNASDYMHNYYNSSLKNEHKDRFTSQKSQIDTTMSAQLQSTVRSSRFLHERDTITFTCTGNIGKPPGKLVWRKTSPKQERAITYYNEATEEEWMPNMCSFKGTSNLTVDISAEDLNATFRCFEESQADVAGMYIETNPLNVHFHVRNITITKQPDKIQYDRNIAKICLTCKGRGNPEPTYKWFKENSSSILARTYFYTIEDVQQNNSGVYICEAYNTIAEFDYYATYSVEIDIVDELLSSTELKSTKISAEPAIYLVILICAVLIGVFVSRRLYYNRSKRKKKERSSCQKQIDCLMSVNDVNSVTNNSIPLAELAGTSCDNKGSKINSRNSGKNKNQETTIDINPQLETNTIYADPSDTIKRSGKTDLDISYTA